MPRQWLFLTNHALVLLHVAEFPDSTLREIAASAGITERAALSLIRSLEADGIISKRKEGRRNRYRVDLPKVMERQVHDRYTVLDLVQRIADLAGQLRRPGSSVTTVRLREEPLPPHDPAHGTPDTMVQRTLDAQLPQGSARLEQTDYGHPGRLNPWETRAVDPPLQPLTEQLLELARALEALLPTK